MYVNRAARPLGVLTSSSFDALCRSFHNIITWHWSSTYIFWRRPPLLLMAAEMHSTCSATMYHLSPSVWWWRLPCAVLPELSLGANALQEPCCVSECPFFSCAFCQEKEPEFRHRKRWGHLVGHAQLERAQFDFLLPLLKFMFLPLWYDKLWNVFWQLSTVQRNKYFEVIKHKLFETHL